MSGLAHASPAPLSGQDGERAPGSAPVTGPALDNKRILAALVDLCVVGAVVALLAMLGGGLTAGIEAVAVGWALYYYFALESGTGQTLGKRLLGLRVVGADGEEPGIERIALRTLLRLVDGIGLYLVGLVVMLVTGERRQRLGDVVARTVVTTAAPAAAPPAEPAEAAETATAAEPAPAPTPTTPAPDVPVADLPPASAPQVAPPTAPAADPAGVSFGDLLDDLAGTPSPTVEPLADAAVAEELPATAPAAEEPAVEEPVLDEPKPAEPAATEPAGEEPVLDEPKPAEPAVEEPAAEEPVLDEPKPAEPAVEEPAAEEPVVEEPAVEEPAEDEPRVEVLSLPAAPDAEEEPQVEEPHESDEPAESDQPSPPVKQMEIRSPIELIMDDLASSPEGAGPEAAAEGPDGRPAAV